MTAPSEWRASIRFRRGSADSADRLTQVLAPEASREVPRTRSQVVRSAPDEVTVEVVARDTGALRAAVNTFLGWGQLTLATEDAARRST